MDSNSAALVAVGGRYHGDGVRQKRASVPHVMWVSKRFEDPSNILVGQSGHDRFRSGLRTGLLSEISFGKV